MEKPGTLAELNEKKTDSQTVDNGPVEKEGETVSDIPENPASYMEELKKYTGSLPDPNEGRIQELREMIRNGKMITKETIRESAEKLTQLFLGRGDFLI